MGGSQSATPTTSKSRPISKLRRFSFKRKHPETRPFRELIENWPIDDLHLLLTEFEADAKIFELQNICDGIRKPSRTFGDDLRATKTDFTVKFKEKSMQTHRHFLANRCKNLKIDRNSSAILDLPANFDKFSENDIFNFLTEWIYLENAENLEKCVVEQLKVEFGCQKRLKDDMKDLLAEDSKNGDLLITISNGEGEEVRCSSQLAASRSPFISSISAQKPSRITFDERIFPAKFARAIIEFFYTDDLDLNSIPNSEDSLSEALALSSGSKASKTEILVENSLKILEIARFFGVQKLVEFCENFIGDNLSFSNSPRIFASCSSKFLRIQAKRFIEREFSQFSNNCLEKLPIDCLKSITRSQFLQTTELDLLNSILSLEKEKSEDVLLTIRDAYVIPPLHQNLTYFREKYSQNPEFFSEFHVDAQWLRFPDFAPGPRYFRPYHKALLKHIQKMPEHARKSADKVIVPELKFENQFPDVLEDEKYSQARILIQNRFDEFWKDVSGFRSFHRDYAIKLITRRTLLELDIPEECVSCHVANCEKPDILA